MKKILSMISMLLVLSMMVTGLVSCSPGEDPSGDSEPTPVEYTNIVADGASNYTIVLSEDATTAVKGLAADLMTEIQTKTGVKLTRVTDNTQKNPVTANEILLGVVSGRDETKTALESMTETGYKLQYANGKLLVTATNDYMMEKAVTRLLNELFVQENSNLKIDKNLNVSYSGAADMTNLVDENGTFKYEVIFSANADNTIRTAATKLAESLRSLFDCKVNVNMDSKAASDASFEILVGLTNRQESIDLYADLEMMETRSRMVGNKIVIGAGMDDKLSDATTSFASQMSELIKGSYDKKYLIQLDYSATKMVYDWLDNVPLLSKGEMQGTDDIGDNSVVMVWTGISADDYTAYLNEIKAAGFTAKQDYTLASNSHTLFEGESANMYTSYISAEQMTRVFVEKKGTTLYPSAEQATYTTIDGYVPTMWQLNVDNKGAKANGGASYVMKVADGSFVIIDGGYNTAVEADRLYNHLKENTTDEKPVISGWIITHQHGDHFGAFQAFTPKYKDKVTVKGFYYNFPAEGYDLGGSMEGSLNTLMRQYTGAKIYRKLHSGMTLWFADMKFEVVYTHEDLYPVTRNTNVNDTSLVLKMTMGGQTVMFLADIEERASKIIERYYVNDASFIKCDIVQYAHHGWEGATKNLYDTIAAATVLWSINTYSWQDNDFEVNIFKRMISSSGSINHYTAYEAEYVKTIIIDGEGIYKLELPYTPRAERLPDYEALYNAIYAAEHAND